VTGSLTSPAPLVPGYGERALSDLLPSVLGALGVAGEDNRLGLPAAPHYCVLLIDGLGWNLLRRHPAEAPFLHSLTARSITAGVPTTTATSLTSLGTGLPPGRHGVVGYTSRVPGGTTLFNALKWEPALDPGSYQPYPTVFERAQRSGVATTVVGQRSFRQTGLTTVALKGPFRGANTYGERVAAAVAGAGAGEPSLVYVYDGDLDYTGHAAGCHSAAWRYQLAMVDRFAEQLFESLPPGTTLAVTADHGMVDVAADARVDVDDVPALRAGVSLIGGEARFRHVYTVDGAASDVLAAWRAVLGARATVLLREEAVAAGWFGAVESRVTERIGDVVVSVGGDCAVEYRSVFPVEAKLVGLHGALTEDELFVPLLLADA
jgi:hypothetical protein